jgi:phosphoribosylglycinamide formyltransferase-1
VNPKPTLSFLASHGGSAAKAIIHAIKNHQLSANIGVVITNNENSAISQWCLENTIKIIHISALTHPNSDQQDKAIEDALSVAETDYVILSGYMKHIKQQTLARFSNKILNVHPALLPKHGGQGMYGNRVHQAVLNAKETISGASIHFINEVYDDGPVIAQQEVPVYPNDTVDTLRQRVQAIEPLLYIKSIAKILEAHPNDLGVTCPN